ncbi:unannotated protein [freshwater metagenome]|uniref:Unannotated protein n=1 Tax=freshwater metagenome TaxID=449393 RepID=A0A6J7QDK4_9ZZZZ
MTWGHEWPGDGGVDRLEAPGVGTDERGAELREPARLAQEHTGVRAEIPLRIGVQQTSPTGVQQHCVARFDLAEASPHGARLEVLDRDAVVVAHEGLSFGRVRDRIVTTLCHVVPEHVEQEPARHEGWAEGGRVERS